MATARPPAALAKNRNRAFFILGGIGLFVVFLPYFAAHSSGNTFLPHLYCYLSNPALTWTNVVADSLIGLSYVAISLTLLSLVRRSRSSVPFDWLILSFGLFIVACGATHFMEVLTIWWPYYWVSASIKIVTAGASVTTAIALPLACPTILRRLNAAESAEEHRIQLESANKELQRLNTELQEYDRIKNSLIAQKAARIGDWEWNVRTGENRWSEAVEEMHGLAPGTYDGRYESWWASVHHEDHPIVERALQHANETGEYEVEYRTVRADGLTYWTAARGKVVYGVDGKPEKMLGICMDVTARKQNEEALLRAEKLAAAGRLAATVAHEINNPLEAVMNLVFIAKTGVGDSEQVLSLAERELSRVAAIAKQTLGFYRDSGAFIDVDLVTVINETLELYSGKLESKSLTIDRQFSAAPSIRARRGDLYQIFANLLTNAIDASPHGGTIRIGVSEVERGDVKIEVVDQGPGVAREIASRLFEPFFTTKKDIGTGLGLWVSKRLAEQLGGTITFANVDHSHGASFLISLPQGAVAIAANSKVIS
jgi:PAS domain S-box-containing protein